MSSTFSDLNIASSNPVDSLTKVISPNKSQKAAAANPEPDALVLDQDIFLSEGYAKHPVVRKPISAPADFYRRGKITTTFEEGRKYEQMPRFVDERSAEEEVASIRLVGTPKGSKEPKDLIPPYTKFFLENVQEAHTERSQVVETFGQFYVFFFGERPPVYNFSGTLINSKNINWLADFMFYYENFLRGTKCVEQNAKIVLTYSGRQIEGFILSTSNTTTSALEKGVQMSFQILVVDRRILQLSADFGLLENDGKFAQDKSFIDLITKQGLASPNVSKAFENVKLNMDGKIPGSYTVPQGASNAKDVTKEFGINVQQTLTGKLSLLG